MNRKPALRTVTLACLTCMGPVQAHHSISMIEIATPVWVKGTVTTYEPKHPHVMFMLEEKGKDGQVHQWAVEGPNLARLERMAVGPDFLKTGEVIEVCGFRLKPPYTKPQFIHGHVLVLPDGHMRHWGPYGRLDNCMRPDDQPLKWVTFLDADPMAHAAWCTSRNYVRIPSVASPAVVDAVNRQMARPCD
jgi:hypothetical protein